MARFVKGSVKFEVKTTFFCRARNSVDRGGLRLGRGWSANERQRRRAEGARTPDLRMENVLRGGDGTTTWRGRNAVVCIGDAKSQLTSWLTEARHQH
jgi:hypothetical protein